MKLKALSNYDGDKSTRFGDCILIYDLTSMIVYDCGHGKHAEYVESFLQKNATITSVSIVVSHNDSDHTNGVCSLLEWLSDQGKYKVTVYTHQYLKHSSTILKKVDDGRRNKDSISQAILIEFDNIKKIIEKAKELNISAQEALDGVCISTCTIVGTFFQLPPKLPLKKPTFPPGLFLEYNNQSFPQAIMFFQIHFEPLPLQSAFVLSLLFSFRKVPFSNLLLLVLYCVPIM